MGLSQLEHFRFRNPEFVQTAAGEVREFSVNADQESGCLKSRGRNNTALTMLKMQVVAPMPSAKQNSATNVKAGVRTSERKVWRIIASYRSTCIAG